MKIVVLIGDGPESEDELAIYDTPERKLKIFHTEYPEYRSLDEKSWINHIFTCRNSF